MFPKLIEVGPFALPTYGVLVALVVFSDLFLAGRRAEGEGLDRWTVFDFGLTVVLFSLLGSKVALVVVPPCEVFHSLSSFIPLIR